MSQAMRIESLGAPPLRIASPDYPPVPESIRPCIISGPSFLKVGDRWIGHAVARITPERAAVIGGENYRNRREFRVVYYARQMFLGVWKLTPQSLAFYEDGSRADGDHRLAALIRGGVTVDFVVTFGWSRDIAAVMDQGLPRLPVDFIRHTLGDLVSGLNFESGAIGAVRILGRGDIGAGWASMVPNEILADWVVETIDAFRIVLPHFSSKQKGVVGRRTEVLAALAAASYRIPRADMDTFCMGLSTGLGMGNDHEQIPLILRKMIQNADSSWKSKRNIACATANAIDLFMKRENRSQLKPKGTVADAVALPEKVRSRMAAFVPASPPPTAEDDG